MLHRFHQSQRKTILESRLDKDGCLTEKGFLFSSVTGTLVKKGEDLFIEFGTTSIKLPADKASNPALKEYIGQEIVMGIRPEHIHDEPMYIANMPDSLMEATVDITELMGAEIYLYLAFEGQEDATNGKTIIARVSSRSQSRAGDQIKVAIDAERIHIFDKDTERCIVH